MAQVAAVVQVRAARDEDDAVGWIRRAFGSHLVVAHDRVFDVTELPALVATARGEVVGVLHYVIDDDGLEVVTIVADPAGRGAGRALLTATFELAPRVRLTTTNDNLPAMGLYQSMGFRMVALRPDAVTRARQVKPEISLTGYRGLPLRDEIDFVRE